MKTPRRVEILKKKLPTFTCVPNRAEKIRMRRLQARPIVHGKKIKFRRTSDPI